MADDRRAETAELRRLRRRIDALDRRIVGLLNERAELAREVGRAKHAAGRRAIRDAEREREVLLRVTMANTGPLPQADLLALYRRLMAATRALEARDRARDVAGPRSNPTLTPDPLVEAGATSQQPSKQTRYAPAPTGYLHLGHVANAIYVWGLARARGAAVLLRIEDHDRSRSRPEYEAALLEDLDWLGFVPDAGPVRQSDDDAPYEAALAALRGGGARLRLRLLANDLHDLGERARPALARAGLPGRLPAARRRGTSPPSRRWAAARSGGWTCSSGRAPTRSSPAGDPPIRDRDGYWTYGFSVVVDDLRQGVDLVIRGRDLIEATPAQIRLGALLGRRRPRSSPTTDSSGPRTARSCPRRTARRASASCGRPAGRRPSSSARRRPRSA